MIDVELLDPADRAWNAHLDRIGALLGVPNNPTVFPYHFLQVVLPRLGGTAVIGRCDGRVAGIGFLFPRRSPSLAEGIRPYAEPAGGGRAFTVRYHVLDPGHDHNAVLRHVQERLGSVHLTLHDPQGPQRYEPTHRPVNGVDIGRPAAGEAADIRDLHQRIWGSPPEFLYPTDVHSIGFQAGTSLVARLVGLDGTRQLAGFLLGFYKLNGPELPAGWGRQCGGLRLESQIMGVLPAYRGLRIANLLKRVQAEEAEQAGIGLVTWTADPLQYPNAALNFGLLRAVAFDFYPDLYPFRNNLNRVMASRFGITWLVRSERVRAVPLVGSQAMVLDLRRHPNVALVNRGWKDIDYSVRSALIAIEIPANWTELQEQDMDVAIAWREASDRIFSRYVGREAGQYVITGVATRGEKRYLIGERVDDGLWERLGRQ